MSALTAVKKFGKELSQDVRRNLWGLTALAIIGGTAAFCELSSKKMTAEEFAKNVVGQGYTLPPQPAPATVSPKPL